MSSSIGSSTTTTTSSTSSTVVYTLVEESTIGSNNNIQYQKYRAFYNVSTSTSTDTIPSTANKKEEIQTRKLLTIRQWIELVLLTTSLVGSTTDNTPDYTVIDNFIKVLSSNVIPYKAYFFEMPPISSLSILPPDNDNNIDNDDDDTINSNHKNRLFEFVIVNSPELYNKVQHDIHNNESNCIYMYDKFFRTSSEKYTSGSIKNNNQYCSVFPNLGNDAILVVPKPEILLNNTSTTGSTNSNFCHLASFIRSSTIQQQKRSIIQKVVSTFVQQLQLIPIYTKTKRTTISSSAASASASFNMQEFSDDTVTVVSFKRPTNSSTHNDDSKKVWLSTSGLGISWLHFRFDQYPKYYSYGPYKKFNKDIVSTIQGR